MRLVGFDEIKIKKVDKGQLAELICEENNLMARGLTGKVSLIGEMAVMMLAFDLKSENNILAQVYKLEGPRGADIFINLYDIQMRTLSSASYQKKTVGDVLNALDMIKLNMPVMAMTEDFTITALTRLKQVTEETVGSSLVQLFDNAIEFCRNEQKNSTL